MSPPDLDETVVEPALRKVDLTNIFSFRSASLSLSNLNVLVGPNGSGKSNLLKVIAFMGAIARSDLIPAIERYGGFERLMFNGSAIKQPTIRIRFEAIVTKYSSQNAPDVYDLSFNQRKIAGNTVLSRKETLHFKRYAGRGRRITVSGGKFYVQEEGGNVDAPRRSINIGAASAGLATIRRLGEVYGAEQANDLANLFETFRVFDIDARRATAPTLRSRVSTVLQPNGGNLAAYLHSLMTERPDLFDALADDLAAVAPSVTGLVVRPYGAGADEGFVVELTERGLVDPTPLSAASFGTVRALALFAMLHDPNPPRLTCIEEIDHGLHPHALDRVVERMRSAANRTQLIAVTHSPALVNRLDPSELIVFERDASSGETLIPKINAEKVRQAEKDEGLGLGELWFSGVLGGVPQ